MNPFAVLWHSLKDLFDELFTLIAVNVLWLLIAGPLLAAAAFVAVNGDFVIAIALALLAVLPAAPATAGLFAVAHRVSEGRVASWRLFLDGFRQYRVLAWKIYGIWTAVLITILINLWFYFQIGSLVGVFLSVLFIYFLAVWCTLLIYLGPLIVIHEDRRLRLIYRNALIMALGRPFFTLLTGILMAIILLLSVWVFIMPVLLTFSFLALWGMRATLAQIAAAEARRQALAEQAAAETGVVVGEKGRGGQLRPRK